MIWSMLIPVMSRLVAVLRSRRTSRLDDLDFMADMQPVLGPQMRRDGYLSVRLSSDPARRKMPCIASWNPS
jgi:hypothetical protein